MKDSRMSQQITVPQPEKTTRTKTQTFVNDNTGVLERKIKQQKKQYT